MQSRRLKGPTMSTTHKFMTTTTKRMSPRTDRAPVDLNHELPSTAPRMDMGSKVSTDVKAKTITHTDDRKSRITKKMMMTICGDCTLVDTACQTLLVFMHT
jgi:hypothetical protein